MHTKLRYLRKEENTSATQMAEVIGLKTGSAYLKKEAGSVHLTLQQAKELSDHFGLSTDELFFQ